MGLDINANILKDKKHKNVNKFFTHKVFPKTHSDHDI